MVQIANRLEHDLGAEATRPYLYPPFWGCVHGHTERERELQAHLEATTRDDMMAVPELPDAFWPRDASDDHSQLQDLREEAHRLQVQITAVLLD